MQYCEKYGLCEFRFEIHGRFLRLDKVCINCVSRVIRMRFSNFFFNNFFLNFFFKFFSNFFQIFFSNVFPNVFFKCVQMCGRSVLINDLIV